MLKLTRNVNKELMGDSHQLTILAIFLIGDCH